MRKTYAAGIPIPVTITEKGKEKILVELTVTGKTFTARDSDKIRDRLLDGIKEVTRDSSAKFLFGSYRGFEVFVERSRRAGAKDGFQLSLLGAEEREFRPGNLFYDFEENLSLSGLFQRIDNFLAKGLDESITTQRENARQEKAEPGNRQIRSWTGVSSAGRVGAGAGKIITPSSGSCNECRMMQATSPPGRPKPL